MKYALTLMTICLLLTVVYSQNTGTESSPLNSAFMIGSLAVDKYTTTELEYADIKGTPYLEKELLRGTIELLDGGFTPEVPLQYDLYRREFFYTDGEGVQRVINTTQCREIILQGTNETYHFRRADPNTADILYDILYEDDSMYIYNHIKTILREGTDNGIVKTDPTFNRDDNYFLLKKGARPKGIKLKKKDIFKLFSKSDQARMEAFIKQGKLKLKKAAEFKSMFAVLKE